MYKVKWDSIGDSLSRAFREKDILIKDSSYQAFIVYKNNILAHLCEDKSEELLGKLILSFRASVMPKEAALISDAIGRIQRLHLGPYFEISAEGHWLLGNDAVNYTNRMMSGKPPLEEDHKKELDERKKMLN